MKKPDKSLVMTICSLVAAGVMAVISRAGEIASERRMDSMEQRIGALENEKRGE
jgi:hypothetical protein